MQWFTDILFEHSFIQAILVLSLICAAGLACNKLKIKGVSLGTAGVFIMALLFGYLFTLPGLQNIPVLSNFYIESAKTSAVTSYKFLENVGLVLFVTAVGYIAGPNFFRNLKKNAKSYVPLGAIIIIIGAALTVESCPSRTSMRLHS